MANAARLGNRVDAGLLIGCVVLSLVAVVLKQEDREPIAGALRRTIVAPLVGLQRGAERWRTAWASREQQQAVLDSLSLRAVNAAALKGENDHLRKLLGLGSRLQWGFVPAEALHNTAPGSEDLVTTLTLTAGSIAGIKKFSPVVAPEGLVGTIQTADPTMSIAILYTNPDFRASAVAADGTTFGIVYPHPDGGGGSDAYLLELRGVPTRSILRPGTVIYTSGLGGTFPRGITIGTVVQELKTAEVWTRTYLVRPAVAPSHITSVLVLMPQRVTQGTGNVWGAAVNADSASRRIVAAGDSVGRQAAALEAQARAAVLDSVRRATADSVRRLLGAVPVAPPGSAPATPTTQTAPAVRDTSAARRPATPRRDSTRPDTARIRPT
ncbi:MAG TPA: rod shape-determining protein MreC [Gemmatimonadaceae bacterium]|nr:rod shape-determining protein MreC [Gemmatimonadaceae bacterium]